MKNMTYLTGVLVEKEGADAFYEHFIDTKTDSTHLFKRPSGELVYTVTADGYLVDKEGQFVGKFRLEFIDESRRNYVWVYKASEGDFTFTSNTDDLLLTEVKLFAQLLKDA